MLKILQNDVKQFKKDFKEIDKKTFIIFVSSIILFTLSWYFSTPKFFTQNFKIHSNLEISEQYSFTYWFILDTILFLLIPISIIKFQFKESIVNYGLNLKLKLNGIVIVFLSIILFLPIIFIVSVSENFVQYFPLMQNAKSSLSQFIKYEIFFLLFIFSWEFIFRGYFLFGLEQKFGIYSIFIQMIPFVILHNGKPFIETFASIFGGIFLGYLAYKFRTIIYGFLIHSIILVTLDLISFLKN